MSLCTFELDVAQNQNVVVDNGKSKCDTTHRIKHINPISSRDAVMSLFPTTMGFRIGILSLSCPILADLGHFTIYILIST